MFCEESLAVSQYREKMKLTPMALAQKMIAYTTVFFDAPAVFETARERAMA